MRLRFTIRDLLWLTALIAVLLVVALAWRTTAKAWIKERHEALEWATDPHNTDGMILAFISQDTHSLPWGLRIWGEDSAVNGFLIDLDKASAKDKLRINQLRSLFPEAAVDTSTVAEWKKPHRIVILPKRRSYVDAWRPLIYKNGEDDGDQATTDPLEIKIWHLP